MEKKRKRIARYNEGFTLFAALVAAGLLILISFAISNISTREVTLANLNRESGKAIFAANAGVECALFWDAKYGSGPGYTSAFSTSTAPATINCNDTSLSAGAAPAGTSSPSFVGGGGYGRSLSLFGFSLHTTQNPTDACAVVTVNKYHESGGTGPLVTEISSYGYNNCNTSDPRRVERGIFVRY